MWFYFISFLILCTQSVQCQAKDSQSQTCNDGLPKLSPDQIPGKCTTFNGSQCYCELNDNCKYESETGRCFNVTDCSKYNDQAATCKYYHCHYDCTSGICSLQDSSPACLAGKDSCYQFCSDVCNCMASGCHYDSAGFCKDRDCMVHLKDETRCRRANTFYAEGGNICSNGENRGECTIEEVVFAVNMGGSKYTDSRGVRYQAHNSSLYSDKDGIGTSVVLDLKDFGEIADADLYKTLTVAGSMKRKTDSCIVYTLPLCKDGEYELSIKTIEISDVIAGEKSFNIKLGEHYAFREVDIVREAGSRFRPVELLVLFDIEDGILTMDGGLSQSLKPWGITLSFCFGDCIFLEGGFQVASFYVAKFSDSKKVLEQNCNVFDGNPWECKSTGCRYNSSMEKCSSGFEKECQIRPALKCKTKCDFMKLELMFVIDSSGTEGQNKPDSRVFEIFPRISKEATTLKEVYPESKYGIVLFSELMCADWNACNQKYSSGKVPHGDPEGCYRLHLPLTEDLETLEQFSQKNQLTERPSGSNEPGLFGAFLTAADKKVKWSNGSPKDVVKVIVLVTDDGLHVKSGFHANEKLEATGDGTDTCAKHKHPPVCKIDEILKREGISLFFVYHNPENKASYDKELFNMETPNTWAYFSEVGTKLTSKLESFVKGEANKKCNSTTG